MKTVLALSKSHFWGYCFEEVGELGQRICFRQAKIATFGALSVTLTYHWVFVVADNVSFQEFRTLAHNEDKVISLARYKARILDWKVFNGFTFQ